MLRNGLLLEEKLAHGSHRGIPINVESEERIINIDSSHYLPTGQSRGHFGPRPRASYHGKDLKRRVDTPSINASRLIHIHIHAHTQAHTYNKTICFLTPIVVHHQYHQKSLSACTDRRVRYSIGGCIHWGSLLCHGVLRRYIIILFVVLQSRERRKKMGTKMKYMQYTCDGI